MLVAVVSVGTGGKTEHQQVLDGFGHKGLQKSREGRFGVVSEKKSDKEDFS